MSALRLLPVAGTRALLAIDGPASATFNTIIEASDRDLGADGNLITLALASGGTWVPNVGTLTLAGNAVEDETVTIGSTVYRWRDTLALAYDVKIGASASASIDNLIAAINANGTPGTHYFAGTLIHPSVRAFAGAGDTMVVHTNSNSILTAVGTLIATTETMTQGSWGATTLADGTDGTNVTFSVAGTAISCVFASGYTTVSDFEAALAANASVAALVRVKTAGTTPLYQLVVTDDDFSATALSGGGATSSAAPTLTDGTLGVAINGLGPCDQALVLLRSVAGSGTMTASLKLWGWHEELDQWYMIGSLNGGSAVAETGTDSIQYAELVIGLRRFSRLYPQIVTLGGTGTEVELYVDPIRATTGSR